MAKFIASNIGTRTQAIKVRGGSVSLRPNTSLPVEPHPDLDEEKISHFAFLGVTFSVPGEKPLDADVKGQKKAKRSAAAAASDVGKASAEKASADKALAAQAAADLSAAEKAVADAREMLDVVGDDMVAKATAEDELKAAEAALATLKG